MKKFLKDIFKDPTESKASSRKFLGIISGLQYILLGLLLNIYFLYSEKNELAIHVWECLGWYSAAMIGVAAAQKFKK